MKKILSLMMCIVLLVGTIGFVSAMTEYELDVYNKITNIFSKIKYAIEKRLFLFTSWGQANSCDEYPKPGNEFWLEKGERIDCDDYCSYDKCALNIWYDDIIYLGRATGPPNRVDWNNWLKEESGEGEYFRGSSSYPWYYVQVYCCPESAPDISDHSTRAYVCERGNWDSKSRYDSDEYCRWDTSGVDLCWCADEDDNFYVDESGGVHCRGSARSSWCSEYIEHNEKDCVGSGTTEYLYWFDSQGNRKDLIEICDSTERCTRTGCVKEDAPANGEEEVVCNAHASKKCYNNDVYWYDSCGSKEEKQVDCGTNSYTGSNYCYDNDVYRDKIDRGCSGSRCISTTSKSKKVECGAIGCSDGVCKTILTNGEDSTNGDGNGEINGNGEVPSFSLNQTLFKVGDFDVTILILLISIGGLFIIKIMFSKKK